MLFNCFNSKAYRPLASAGGNGSELEAIKTILTSELFIVHDIIITPQYLMNLFIFTRFWVNINGLNLLSLISYMVS